LQKRKEEKEKMIKIMELTLKEKENLEELDKIK